MIVLNFDFLRGRFIFFVQFLISVFLNCKFIGLYHFEINNKDKYTKIICETNLNKTK